MADRIDLYQTAGKAALKEIARKPEYIPLAIVVGFPKIRRPVYHVMAATVSETIKFKKRLLKAQVANVFNQKKIRSTKFARGLQGIVLGEVILHTAPLMYKGAKMQASSPGAGFIML